MAKRKLTHQQAQRIAAIQDKRHQELQPNSQIGRLVATFGENALVADSNWTLWTCHLRQHLPDPAPGDFVIWETQTEDTGIITAIQPRSTLLNRLTYEGEKKPIATNITQMIITVAAEPPPNSELIDRYLIAAEHSGFKVLLLLNKIDLATAHQYTTLCDLYQSLGYAVLGTSTTQNIHLDELRSYLANETSIFVGQSGVGKSSLIQYILPNQTLRIGSISDNKQQGRHTTTTTTLYRLENEGYLIDSPGVRQFRLWNPSRMEILEGFKEIKDYSQHCQFRNCSHEHDPGCAVQAALERGDLHIQRHMNWLKIQANP